MSFLYSVTLTIGVVLIVGSYTDHVSVPVIVGVSMICTVIASWMARGDGE